MRILKTLLVAALISLVGCSGVSRYSRPVLPHRESSQSLVITPQLIKTAAGGSARYIVKEKIQILDQKGNLTTLYRNLWTGSAFCIGVKINSLGQKYSIWATCQHVADTTGIPNTVAEIDYVNSNGEFSWAPVDQVKISKAYDIAVFTSLALSRTVFQIASETELENLVMGDFLLAVGHPAGMFPAVMTVGAYLWEVKTVKNGGFRFTTSGYYGSSGGALIDAKTMKVIGVVYRFAGSKNRDGSYRSDDLMAVPINKLQELMVF